MDVSNQLKIAGRICLLTMTCLLFVERSQSSAQEYLREYREDLLDKQIRERQTRLDEQRESAARARQASASRAVTPAKPGSVVSNVIIEGNNRVPDDQVLARLRTRSNRKYDPDQLQADTREIMRMRFFQSVRTFTESDANGNAVIIFKVDERPFINKVKIIGNRQLTDRAIEKNIDIEPGMPLDIYAVKMARQKIESFYETKGYENTEVSIVKGDSLEHNEVIFLVNEDEPLRISGVSMQGNTIASDARLVSFIKSKKSILRTFGGKFSRQKLEADKQTLTAYYRGLGFFNARVGADVVPSENGKYVKIAFVIDEGPRFKVRDVQFIGTEKYSPDQLASVLTLKPGDEYNASKRQADITKITDLYGSEGHIAVQVMPENLFFEEPGIVDLIYKINEGAQYRVGKIEVAIDGDHGITRKQVVLNRLGLKPGDVIDMRKIRSAERRLAASQLFTAPNGGPVKLDVQPRSQLASNQQGIRFQSPDERQAKVVVLDFTIRGEQ